MRSAGHRVTAIDLAASGIHPMRLEEVTAFAEYSTPLMDFLASLPLGESIVLVGHGFRGMSVALAMERFPEKVAVAVFVAAFMLDTSSPPSYVLDQD
ncbi:Polyneuridine-aldehyde esterase [Acorus gramineus]|uniref:Polyneuridine-aldehyde esterase n=1 Tax=Acorus gramineus TaxID=55184 RepID=A0AAV9BI19_ACOGR|nr:Polyneuridine-aldehyde esterase [Acorus gramineus]